ncbi:unnamed protein product [Rhizoctonia solani]|uniref:Uncharacterized protein n=1 Tax=Rhizoctonia solani TaxID=456999 RepID=A0A8H3CDE8_9AGAM|nr:unnamed protein product [Rhizoctonia solani]
MHARRSALGMPGDKDVPPDEQLQLELYDNDTPLLRTDRLPPASFEPPPQPEIYRPCLPHFQPPATNDYRADLNLAELLMSDTDDSLGSAGLGHLTLSSIAMRTHQPGAKFANAPSRAHNRASTSRFDMRFAPRSMPMESTPLMPSLSWSSSSNSSSPATTSARLSVDHVTTDHQPVSDMQNTTNPNPADEPPSPATPKAQPSSTEAKASSNTTTKQRPARSTRRSPAPRRQECTTCGKRFQRPCQLVTCPPET